MKRMIKNNDSKKYCLYYDLIVSVDEDEYGEATIAATFDLSPSDGVKFLGDKVRPKYYLTPQQYGDYQSAVETMVQTVFNSGFTIVSYKQSSNYSIYAMLEPSDDKYSDLKIFMRFRFSNHESTGDFESDTPISVNSIDDQNMKKIIINNTVYDYVNRRQFVFNGSHGHDVVVASRRVAEECKSALKDFEQLLGDKDE